MKIWLDSDIILGFAGCLLVSWTLMIPQWSANGCILILSETHENIEANIHVLNGKTG